MKTRKLISFILAAVILATSLAFSAVAAGETVVYKFMVTSDEVNAYAGKVTYPSALTVSSVKGYKGLDAMICGLQYNSSKSGEISFNATSAKTPYSFAEEASMIEVTFTANADFNASMINTSVKEFYTNAQTSTKENIPFRYRNVVDGERISSGSCNIDAGEDIRDVDYTLVYSFMESTFSTTPATITKTVTAPSTTALNQIAELNKPRIISPYYSRYTVGEVSAENDIISVSLVGAEAKYDVFVNGDELSEDGFSYEDIATITADKDSKFIIGNDVVATGTQFKVFVTEDLDITVEDNDESTPAEGVSANFSGIYMSDKEGGRFVNVSLLATARTDREQFERMGVVFGTTRLTDVDEIKDGIRAITSGAARYQNKFAVYNSTKVTVPNVSGQYQFIYEPYYNTTALNKDMSIYYYTFLVKKDGTILVSSVDLPAVAKMSDVMA